MTTCKRPTCTNQVGEQDRDDYQINRFCSVQCDVKHQHIKADARDAKESVEREAKPREDYF